MKSRLKVKEKQRKLERRERNRGKRRVMILIILILILLLAIWGKFGEPNILAINDYKIESDKISKDFNGLKIVQFSDLHFGSYKEHRLDKLVKNINSLKPDIVVFTGDLIEENYEITDKEIKSLVNHLSKINAKLGKYTVIGNHDVNNEHFENIMYDSKFILLKNNYDIIYNEKSEPLLLFGLDDSLEGSPNISSIKEKNLLNIQYKIVLMHEPDYIDEFVSDYDVSLVLAGHSHNGQVKIPGIRPIYLPKGCKKYYKSYYDVKGVPLYISNGVGGSILDFRLGSIPSINVYRLYQK